MSIWSIELGFSGWLKLQKNLIGGRGIQSQKTFARMLWENYPSRYHQRRINFLIWICLAKQIQTKESILQKWLFRWISQRSFIKKNQQLCTTFLLPSSQINSIKIYSYLSQNQFNIFGWYLIKLATVVGRLDLLGERPVSILRVMLLFCNKNIFFGRMQD